MKKFPVAKNVHFLTLTCLLFACTKQYEVGTKDEPLKLYFVPSDNTQKIEKNAFWINLKLKSVIIPSSVKFIGKGAFSGCRNLTNIEILGTNTVIDAEAFQYCPRQPANPQSPTSPQQNP
jgi:hypothetical protein